MDRSYLPSAKAERSVIDNNGGDIVHSTLYTLSFLYGTLDCVSDYGGCVVRTILLLILILYTIHPPQHQL
jgi:hypothetical protein